MKLKIKRKTFSERLSLRLFAFDFGVNLVVGGDVNVDTSFLVVDVTLVVANLVVGVMVVEVKGVVVVVVVIFLGKQKSAEASIIDVNASLEIFK